MFYVRKHRKVFSKFTAPSAKETYQNADSAPDANTQLMFELRFNDRLCGLVVRVLDYRTRGLGFDSRALQKKVVGLERGPLSLVSTTEELLDRKVAVPV
jgi:hypothetical protein